MRPRPRSTLRPVTRVVRKGGVSRIIRTSYHTEDKSWYDTLREVAKRDGNTCADCKSSTKPVERHHIIPLSRGGTNALRNLITLCTECHARRHGHMFSRLL